MAYSIDRMPERISIGRETETGVTDVMIDCGAWVDKWPGMELHAIHTPDGGAPYILQTETDGGVLVWHVTDADTATPGTGLVEIVGETDGRRKVSEMVKVYVAARMGGTVGEPPEAAKPWVESVIGAADRITGMKAQAETLDAGSGATAAWDGEQGLLTIGVPKGEQGPKGEKGEKGPQGEKGEPGKDAVVDTTLTKSGQAADAKATGDALASKLTEPSSGLEVGKYFRVAAIDENGHAVLEAVDLPSAHVQDVLVNGASIVSDGVANVPLANASTYGVLKIGTGLRVDEGIVTPLPGPYKTAIDVRDPDNLWTNTLACYAPITGNSLDYAVKAAMCDGKGAAWTSDEQASARERMGIDKPYELIEESTLEEDAVYIVRNAEPDGTTYNFRKLICIVKLPNGNVDRNIGWSYDVNGIKMVSYWVNQKSQHALYMSFYADVIGNRLFCRSSLARTSENGGSNIGNQPKSVSELGYYAANAITSIRVKEINGVGYPAGAIIKIYGVRA